MTRLVKPKYTSASLDWHGKILCKSPVGVGSMSQSDKLTIKEVARELEVDERTVRRWIKNKDLPYAGFDIRGRYLVYRADLDDFVKRRTQVRDEES
jgi:excisionase family DNA binding protein